MDVLQFVVFAQTPAVVVFVLSGADGAAAGAGEARAGGQ